MKSGAVARRVSVAAMIVALCLVVSMLPSLPGPFTKFGGLPLLIGGLLIGPRTAFAVGCLTDIIGFALHPTGFFFPGFTLTQGLTAMIPGYFAQGKDPYTWRDLNAPDGGPIGGQVGSYLRLLGIFTVTQVITSVLLVSVFTSKIVRGTPLELELITRAGAQALHLPIYALVALSVLTALSKTDLYKRLLVSRR